MGRLIDADKELIELKKMKVADDADKQSIRFAILEFENAPTVEGIPKDNVYKAILEIMKYEHEGFINISLARLDEILKKCGVSEDGNE